MAWSHHGLSFSYLRCVKVTTGGVRSFLGVICVNFNCLSQSSGVTMSPGCWSEVEPMSFCDCNLSNACLLLRLTRHAYDSRKASIIWQLTLSIIYYGIFCMDIFTRAKQYGLIYWFVTIVIISFCHAIIQYNSLSHNKCVSSHAQRSFVHPETCTPAKLCMYNCMCIRVWCNILIYNDCDTYLYAL